jgi:hypothetical protein
MEKLGGLVVVEPAAHTLLVLYYHKVVEAKVAAATEYLLKNQVQTQVHSLVQLTSTPWPILAVVVVDRVKTAKIVMGLQQVVDLHLALVDLVSLLFATQFKGNNNEL